MKKRENFQRLSELRTNNILKALRVLGNCANKNAYEYTKQEIKKMFNAISEAIKETKLKFKKSPKKFTL